MSEKLNKQKRNAHSHNKSKGATDFLKEIALGSTSLQVDFNLNFKLPHISMQLCHR